MGIVLCDLNRILGRFGIKDWWFSLLEPWEFDVLTVWLNLFVKVRQRMRLRQQRIFPMRVYLGIFRETFSVCVYIGTWISFQTIFGIFNQFTSCLLKVEGPQTLLLWEPARLSSVNFGLNPAVNKVLDSSANPPKWTEKLLRILLAFIVH